MSIGSAERVAVVGGGTGNIGEGIVRALLRSGLRVVVPSRSRDRLEALRGYVREADVSDARLETLEADVSDFGEAESFVAEVLKRHGRIDLGVASLGGWWRGSPLMETGWADWQQVTRDNLQSHYTFARHVLPVMRQQGAGTHVMIGGPGNLLYAPASSLISIAGTAQLQMARIFAQEAGQYGVRVYQLFIADILDRQRGGGRREGWITPDDVGEYALTLHLEHPPETSQKLMPQDLPGFDPGSDSLQPAGSGFEVEDVVGEKQM